MNPEPSQSLDQDILKCRTDIQRAMGLVPPLGIPATQAASIHTVMSEPIPAMPENNDPIKELKAKMAEALESSPEPSVQETWMNIIPQSDPLSQIEPPDEAADEIDEESEIPKFNLAEQIMAQQRKLSANRRRAPGQKSPEPAASTNPSAATVPPRSKIQDLPAAPPQGRLISMIVARDIEKLRSGMSVF